MIRTQEKFAPERNCYKVLFKARGHLAFIYSLLEMGVCVKCDPDYNYAMACFDNTIDFNDFKSKLLALSIA